MIPDRSAGGLTHKPSNVKYRVRWWYSGTSLMRNTPLLGPYSRTTPRVLWWSLGGGVFLMSEVPLCPTMPRMRPDSHKRVRSATFVRNLVRVRIQLEYDWATKTTKITTQVDQTRKAEYVCSNLCCQIVFKLNTRPDEIGSASAARNATRVRPLPRSVPYAFRPS